MQKPTDLQAKATECRKLALQAMDAAARERWFSMERFWLNQMTADKTAPDIEAEIIEL
jgi:hypothetical protein